MEIYINIHKYLFPGTFSITEYIPADVDSNIRIALQKPGIDFLLAKKQPNTIKSTAAIPK